MDDASAFAPPLFAAAPPPQRTRAISPAHRFRSDSQPRALGGKLRAFHLELLPRDARGGSPRAPSCRQPPRRPRRAPRGAPPRRRRRAVARFPVWPPPARRASRRAPPRFFSLLAERPRLLARRARSRPPRRSPWTLWRAASSTSSRSVLASSFFAEKALTSLAFCDAISASAARALRRPASTSAHRSAALRSSSSNVSSRASAALRCRVLLLQRRVLIGDDARRGARVLRRAPRLRPDDALETPASAAGGRRGIARVRPTDAERVSSRVVGATPAVSDAIRDSTCAAFAAAASVAVDAPVAPGRRRARLARAQPPRPSTARHPCVLGLGLEPARAVSFSLTVSTVTPLVASSPLGVLIPWLRTLTLAFAERRSSKPPAEWGRRRRLLGGGGGDRAFPARRRRWASATSDAPAERKPPAMPPATRGGGGGAARRVRRGPRRGRPEPGPR